MQRGEVDDEDFGRSHVFDGHHRHDPPAVAGKVLELPIPFAGTGRNECGLNTETLGCFGKHDPNVHDGSSLPPMAISIHSTCLPLLTDCASRMMTVLGEYRQPFPT
jgi:hypothetical protein